MTSDIDQRLAELKEPFNPKEVEWKPRGKPFNGKQTVLPYVKKNALFKRLDEVCGPHGWQRKDTMGPDGRAVVEVSILWGETWITKSDAAGRTAFEGDKGSHTDAFKRACKAHGPGRYLDYVPPQQAALNEKGKVPWGFKGELPNWALPNAKSK